MNKKFSTLLASVLLTSAFSVNAVEEGQFVRLKVGSSQYLTVDKSFKATNSIESAANEDKFEQLFSQWWKVAKVSKTSTGEPTYQFVNKQTGEYLAIKLESDNKAEGDVVVETKNIKLNQAGNREWAFKNGKLYAYSAKDTTYSIKVNDNGTISLLAKKSNKVPTGATSAEMSEDEMGFSLNATSFNALMGLIGNDGKLHFNNSKNVSKDEKNVLENTKWEAKAMTDGFALTDGSKVEGYADDMSYVDGNSEKGYKKVDKLNYLMVDTAYYDKGEKYFKLVKDTVAYENLTGSLSSKPGAVRPVEAAEFGATYWMHNDSIVLSAKYVPTKAPVATTEGELELTETEGLATLENLAKGEDLYTNATGNKNAIDALWTAFDAWNTGGHTGESVNATFAQSAAGETAIAAVQGLGTAVTAYANALGAVKVTTAYAEHDDVDAIISGDDQIGTLKQAADAAVAANWNTAAMNDRKKCYWRIQDAYVAWSAQANLNTLAKDAKFSDSYADLFTEFESYSVANTDITNYISALGNVKVATAYVPESVTNAVTDYDETSVADLKTAAKASAAYTYADLLDEVTNAYGDWTVLGNEAEEGTFANYAGASAAITNLQALLTDEPIATAQAYLNGMKASEYELTGEGEAVLGKYFFIKKGAIDYNTVADNGQVVLRNLSTATVLTVVNDGSNEDELEDAGYIEPLIQPYATTGGDAEIATTKYHFLQVKNEGKNYETSLKAASLANKYWAINWTDGVTGTDLVTVAEVSEANPFTQWAFVEGATGSYSIINRATEKAIYSGPLFKVAGEEDTYTNGTDTLKVAAVEIPESAIITEGTKKYDISGQFYPGKEEELIQRLFSVSPVSPFMSQLAMQVNKDSVLILGDAADAPVWQLKQVADSKKTYGYTLDGYAPLLQVKYNIYTTDADGNVYYVINDVDGDTYEEGEAYRITKSDSKMGDEDKAAFTFYAVAPGQYLMVDEDGLKVTINPTPAKPILETSDVDWERDDYFTFTQVNQNVYRELGVSIEDNLTAKAPNVAKIFMDNEPNRFLYENTANIVANNGKGLNFLGIYNSAELTKNAALYVDTAWVDRKDNLKPLYMLAVDVETVDAKDAVACTYEHNHFDNAGNKVDAEHCSHATPATLGYKQGRYLVALNDSVPENLSKNSPVYYDGKVRLAFVDAIHYLTKDTLVIKKSKYTGNSKQQVAGEETTWAAKDTIKITKDLNAATFALRIKDQATKSFYLENANGYVRILNGVPVLEKTITDAAIFNIAATEEEATANEAIAAEGVQVIAGKGTVTVQGAAGKVITVANILGQTIANQVAASDNVTIAAPAGVVVVAVDGEATKVVVK